MNAEHFSKLANSELDRDLKIAVAEFKVAVKEAALSGKTQTWFIKREVERFLGRFGDDACANKASYPRKLARFCELLEADGFKTSFSRNGSGNWYFGIAWGAPAPAGRRPG